MKIEVTGTSPFTYIYLRDARGRLRPAHFSAPGMNQDTRAIFTDEKAAREFLEQHGDQRRTYILSGIKYG